MSIVAADLVAFAAASMPADDSSTSGGAIDLLRRVDFTQMASNDTIEAISSNAGDTTQTLTLTGRKADGSIVSEGKTLTGTSQIVYADTYERLLKAELSGTCAGIVTVRRATGDVLIRTIPIGERGFMAIIRQIASHPSNQVDAYLKFFWKNTHGSLTLTTAAILENADPSTVITHALDAALDGTTSVANRLTDPGFTFNGSSKAVPNSQNLTFGTAIGVWLKLTLAGGAAALKTTYTSEITGQTT